MDEDLSASRTETGIRLTAPTRFRVGEAWVRALVVALVARPSLGVPTLQSFIGLVVLPKCCQ